METALVTGMFETSFLPKKQVELDVKNEKTGSFNEILESSLKSNDVVKNEIKDYKTEQDVSSETIDTEEKKVGTGQKTNDEENTKDVNEENEGKLKKKDKKIREDVVISDLVPQSNLTKLIEKENIKEQDVDEMIGSIKNGENKVIELTPEEKLDDLLSKLDVELNENVKTKDDGEKVIEVGPQSVETEKIKLNINDVDRNEDVLENKEGLTFSIEEKEVENLGKENLEDVSGFRSEDSKNESLEQIGKENKTEVEKNKTIEEHGSLLGEDVVNNGTAEKKRFEQEDKGFSKQKEDKVKIKDFRTKEDVDAIQKFIKEETVKLDNSLEIKDVNNIKKFENIDVNQMDILDQVTEKLEVSLFDNKSEMVIKLKPNDLGNVTVKITIENGVMNAKFLAESTKVKEALESNLNNLKESLKDQGLNVQDLNVSVDSGRSQNHNFNQNNLIYLNDKKSYQSDKVVGYEDFYYESGNDEKKGNHYWMDSTVSFLA